MVANSDRSNSFNTTGASREENMCMTSMNSVCLVFVVKKPLPGSKMFPFPPNVSDSWEWPIMNKNGQI